VLGSQTLPWTYCGWSWILCAIIFNDIVWKKVSTCHENNLVLTQIFMQCPLPYARCIFSEMGMKIVNDTKIVLAPHHPCINIIVTHQSWLNHINDQCIRSWMFSPHLLPQVVSQCYFLRTLASSYLFDAYNVMP
jgi:hypothetical protein